MLNLRRALAAAAFVIFVLTLITRSHRGHGPDGARLPVAKDSVDAMTAEYKYNHAGGNKAKLPVVQKPMMDMSRMSTYEKLAYQYPYDMEAKFPAYIWQTWRYTPSDGEFDFRPHEASWTIHHPGFVHEVVTDAMAVTVLRLFYAGIPEILEAYHALPLPVLKADFFRYLILYARGGIYSDIDTYAIRSAVEWVPSNIPRETVGLVIGIEADPDREDWAEWYSRRIQFCQWTIQSKPGHPVLRDIIHRITNETLTLKRSGQLADLDYRKVVDITGPAKWTDTIMDYFNDGRFFDMKNSKIRIDYKQFTGMTSSKKVGDVVILPITSFSPGVGQMGAGDIDDPMAFVKHDFEGTWKPESERHMGEEIEFEE
ncbi:Initiation-specific alpha-1 [Escovopsis weberi]|uniref:Initiation-specific alpha-1 n=1 Tax=Escovopsis weberi TaxID=150374 RepID=A0A0M8N6P4_ESCWE|nr:Initiation-specific alpha-1 [Escovopsis weberi]